MYYIFQLKKSKAAGSRLVFFFTCNVFKMLTKNNWSYKSDIYLSNTIMSKKIGICLEKKTKKFQNPSLILLLIFIIME